MAVGLAARKDFVSLVKVKVESGKVRIPDSLSKGRGSVLARILGGNPQLCREEELREIVTLVWRRMKERDEAMRLVFRLLPPAWYVRPSPNRRQRYINRRRYRPNKVCK